MYAGFIPGFRPGFGVFSPVPNTWYVVITRTKQLASPLVAHVSGGSAPRCPCHRRGRCKQGSLGISWSEEQAGLCFHLENLTDCQKRGAGHY